MAPPANNGRGAANVDRAVDGAGVLTLGEQQPAGTAISRMLGFALHYALRGWSIIAIKRGTKKAAGSWKEHQKIRADESKLEKWFGNGQDYGIAVVLGQVSGGLICRDFDDQKAYDRWAAAHPDLAKTLPTVKTNRGAGVYFRAASADLFYLDLRTIDPPEDGEYRGGSGHYCVLPPSLHPSGATYTWLIPLPDGEIPFVADVHAAGLLPRASPETERTERTETAECTETTEDDRRQLRQQRITEIAEPTEAIVGVVGVAPPRPTTNGSVLSVTSDPADEIERVILETIPAAIGRRHRQIFDLARALKAIPRLADAPGDALKPHVRQWHKIGLERGVIATEPFEETWIDFLRAWKRVKFPKGSGPLTAILQRAKDSPLPTEAEQYECQGVRLLVAICRELQRESANKPFFLSCRTAANLLELGTNGQVKAWRWLGLLVHDGIIEETERAKPGAGRASRYRYTGGRKT